MNSSILSYISFSQREIIPKHDAGDIGYTYRIAVKTTRHPWKFLGAEGDGIVAVGTLSASPQSGITGFVVGIRIRVRAVVL